MFRQLTIATDDLIAYEAQVSKQLMIMRFAIGQSTFLVVPMAQKWFFTLGTHEMLDVPMLSERSNNTLFDWTTTSATDGNSHFIMATQTIQFIHVVGRKTWTTLHFTSRRIQFTIAWCAIEMVTVVDFTTETKRLAIDNTTGREKGNRSNFLLSFWFFYSKVNWKQNQQLTGIFGKRIFQVHPPFLWHCNRDTKRDSVEINKIKIITVFFK